MQSGQFRQFENIISYTNVSQTRIIRLGVVPLADLDGIRLPDSPDMHAQVQALLTLSRAEHLAKKHAAGKADKRGIVTQPPNYPKAEDHIHKALEAREQAEALDPEHQDPAWIADQAANKGRTSAELLAWFKLYLTLP